MHKIKVLILVLCVESLLGCAKPQPDTLFLESMTTEAERKAEENAALQTHPTDAYTPAALKNMQEAMKHSVLPLPELVLFSVPPSYRSVYGPLLDKIKREKSYDLDPETEVLWDNSLGTLITAAHKNLAPDLAASSKEDFLKSLDEITRFYDEQSMKTYSSHAEGVVDDLGPLKRLTITVKYQKANVGYTHTRRFYFYNPSYQLEVGIQGEDESLKVALPDLEKALHLLEKRLAALYPLGLSAKKMPEETVSESPKA